MTFEERARTLETAKALVRLVVDQLNTASKTCRSCNTPVRSNKEDWHADQELTGCIRRLEKWSRIYRGETLPDEEATPTGGTARER